MDKLLRVGLALLLTPGWEDLPFLPWSSVPDTVLQPGLGATRAPCHPVTTVVAGLVLMDTL